MSVEDDSPVHSSSSDDFAAFLDGELDSTSDTPPEPQHDDNDESDDDEDYEYDERIKRCKIEVVETTVEVIENPVDSLASTSHEEQGTTSGDIFHSNFIVFFKYDIFSAPKKVLSSRVGKIELYTEFRMFILMFSLMEVIENPVDSLASTSHEEQGTTSDTSLKIDVCTHPGILGGLCIRCGEKVDDQSGVAFGYIHKDLRLANDEIARLRDKDLKILFRHKKLYLVLDLDHTLLNSTHLKDITPEEQYLMSQTDSLHDPGKGSLFRLDSMPMMTKLRPFVHSFLKEASKLFEMYIYTMGERAYAIQMAKLLDPENVYFNSKVIAQGDCTQRHQKGLDVVLGQESAVVILDDTEPVWAKHKANLILMDRYHYFASSCKQFGFSCQSLSQLKKDENEADGALATVLEVLKRVHNMFYDSACGDNLADRDVRQMLRIVKKEVLRGCRIVFSRIFPTKFQAENHQLWKLAEALGATCSTEIDETVTHVVCTDSTTEKSRWALKEKKFVVHPRWIEASNYLWLKQPEENFPVNQLKTKPLID